MRMDESGVSPVIATILLIALTVVAVGIVAVFLTSISPGSPTVNTQVQLQSWNENSVTFYHRGGQTVNVADLKLLKSGTEVTGATWTPSSGTWSVGQTLTISNITSISENDVITLVYKPANQQLFSENLRFWTG
jgi:flagellin-like protein